MTNQARSLDLISATTVVAASMVGAGVYTTSGYTLASLNSPWLVILAWAVGGLIAICGAISYGALASRFTESGGEYLFLARSLHPIAGVMAGWVSLLVGFTAAIAYAAITLETYVGPLLFADPAVFPTTAVAITVVLLTAVLHTASVRPSARVQDFVVGLKLLMLGSFVAVAIGAHHRWVGWSPLPAPSTFPIRGFATSLVYISFSYAGFNAAVYIAGEIKDPQRTVPRAMVWGTVVVTIVYVVLNAIFVLAPDANLIAGQEQVAAIAADAIAGSHFSTFVRIVIVISLLTSVSALMMTGPRVYARMADDGFLPRIFGYRGRSPALAIWFQAIAAILVICWFQSLHTLLSYLGFTLSISSALTVCMLFVLRQRGESIRPRWYAVPAVLFVSATLTTATIAAINEPRQALAAVVTISIGAALYPFTNRNVAERPRTERPRTDRPRTDGPTTDSPTTEPSTTNDHA